MVVQEAGKGIILSLKKLSLRSDDIVEMMAAISLCEVAAGISDQLQAISIWNFLPPVCVVFFIVT